jgi:nucleoside-diphosphate-sugar epimerase
MIVGNGLIAKAFHENYANRDDVLIFASGVSNSSNTDPNEFFRERVLLESFLSERKKIIYFSTCSIEDSSLENSPYISHKLEMEGLVKAANDYLIFRLPQVAGKTENPNTLLNFLYHKIKNQELFKIYGKASRNIVDVDDIESIVNYIINENLLKNKIINIASPIHSPPIDLVHYFERILMKKAVIEFINCGTNYIIDSELSLKYADRVGIRFDKNYIFLTLSKYYAE